MKDQPPPWIVLVVFVVVALICGAVMLWVLWRERDK